MKKQILIIEDERDIAELIEFQLKTKGFETKIIDHGAEALDFIQAGQDIENVDLIILDRMLPEHDGLEICRFIRMFKKTKKLPVLMLTALSQENDIIAGLDAGADDYLTKPFSIEVLMARVKSLMRRSDWQKTEQINLVESGNILSQGSIKIDVDQCKAWVDDKEVELTLSEYKLLCIFLKDPGKVFTRQHLVESIQDGPVHVTERTIDTHIFGLRKKIGAYSNMIETIRGIGYRVTNEAK